MIPDLKAHDMSDHRVISPGDVISPSRGSRGDTPHVKSFRLEGSKDQATSLGPIIRSQFEANTT
jgi:hypothetical protein